MMDISRSLPGDSGGHLRPPLTGKVAMVTGAGRGIGKAIAIGLADAGAGVACLDVDVTGAAATAKAIAARHGAGRAWGSRCDVTEWGDIRQSLEDVEGTLGEVDVVVANAGGPQGQARPFLELDPDSWGEMIDRNFTGAFYTGLVYGRAMARRGRGCMVFIASQLSSVVRPGLTHYAAAKAGVAHLVRGMAVELAPLGVRVNGLAPGPIDTPGTAGLFSRPGAREALESLIPQGRVGEAEEMVGPVVFLASDAASYVTGHILCADGGYTLT